MTTLTDVIRLEAEVTQLLIEAEMRFIEAVQYECNCSECRGLPIGDHRRAHYVSGPVLTPWPNMPKDLPGPTTGQNRPFETK